MFAITEITKDGFDTVVLRDDRSSTTIEIVPDCGAMLRAFTLQDGNQLLNLIDSYPDKQAFDDAAESGGFKGLKLSPFPCRIQNAMYNFSTKQYHFTSNINNGSALHGLLYKRPFTIIQKDADEDSATIVLLHEYKGTDPGYPFHYNCIIEYKLKKNNTLTIETKVINKTDSSIPVADGWHPYFSFGKKVDALELQFQSEEILEFIDLIPSGKILHDNSFITATPIGSTVLDNSFVLDFSKVQPMCVLRDPASGWQLEIHPNVSYPYLQIYIPTHRNSIAIENLSAPPDSFNNGMGLIVLDAGKEASFTTKYIVRKS